MEFRNFNFGWTPTVVNLVGVRPKNIYIHINIYIHSNFVLAEICLKMVECAQFNFHHQFWSYIVEVGQNSTHGWFLCANLGEIQPVWKVFGQIRWRFLPFETNFGQKKITVCIIKEVI
jgi:hypothetical protein